MNFSWFINYISPTQKEIEQLRISWWIIRNTIINNSEIISQSYLTWSYKRWTKISPIDDLDIIFNVNFGNTHIENYNSLTYIALNYWTYENHQLKNFSVWDNNIEKYIVHPVKIINHIWNIISSRYTSTENKWRNWECYSVRLSSYNLSIDCLPYTWVKNEDYKLIPYWWNNLSWKKTNPRLDEEKLNILNNEFNWKVKWVIKIIKYWNKEKNTTKKFKSYILESLIYRAVKKNCYSRYSYTEILKEVVQYIYWNVEKHRNIKDICGYDFMHYSLDTYQINNLKNKLEILYSKNNIWEEALVDYLLN